MDTRSIQLSDAIDLYVLDCQAQRFAARTVETAQFRLRTFLRHAGDPPLDQITANHIRTYQVALQKRGYSAGYQHGLSAACAPSAIIACEMTCCSYPP